MENTECRSVYDKISNRLERRQRKTGRRHKIGGFPFRVLSVWNYWQQEPFAIYTCLYICAKCVSMDTAQSRNYLLTNSAIEFNRPTASKSKSTHRRSSLFSQSFAKNFRIAPRRQKQLNHHHRPRRLATFPPQSPPIAKMGFHLFRCHTAKKKKKQQSNQQSQQRQGAFQLTLVARGPCQKKHKTQKRTESKTINHIYLCIGNWMHMH